MVGSEGEAFSNRVLHYATSLRGTRQYWFRQRSRLISMVDTLGLPTIFFTHSAADLQWPELAHLICPEDPDNPAARVKAVNENPAIADWFFCHRVQKFLDAFYVGVLKATDYWVRFEWQHRGSPHVHGVAWLPNAPDVEQLLASAELPDTLRREVIQHADRTVTTLNPALSSSADSDSQWPAPETNPHVCNKSYLDVQDHHQDLCELVATCQRHTRCSEAYCLRTRHGRQECRFGYPKPLQPETTIVIDPEPTLLTARNDGMINSFNPVQLSAWRANVDMQYIVSRRRVIDYCTKYITKSEPRSETLKDTFTRIVRGLKDGNHSLKAVQKLLIHSVGDRDYSAQETCHILLQLPMFKASRDFIILSLDGSRAVQDHFQQDGRATAPSILDHYIARPAASHLRSITLLEFAQQFTMPKELGAEPNRRSKNVVVIACPYCSPDPAGPKYEQYCRQSLMQHKPFCQLSELLAQHETYAEAYTEFLQTGNIPPTLQEDIFRLQQLEASQETTQNEVNMTVNNCAYYHLHINAVALITLTLLLWVHLQEDEESQQPTQRQPPRAQEEWMLICQHNGDFQPDASSQEDFDWTSAAQSYPNLEEAPTFITRHRQHTAPRVFTTTASPNNLQGTQLYTTVRDHFTSNSPTPLRLIITGTAGTGKSYLIQCLRLLFSDTLKVAAPTGVASFIIDGTTLHSLLHLPTRGEFKELEGNRLLQLQQVMSTIKYIIIDEMSMVGRKLLGQIDRRLRQAFPHHAKQVFGGCSILLFGDFGQLPPVMDLPLYTTDTRSDLSDQGRTAYLQFDKAFTLTRIIRQAGQDPEQARFRDILLRLRNAQVTMEDWNCLMKQTPTNVPDLTPFANALRLHPTVEAVVEHNVAKLQASGQPIATIKAVHTGTNAAKASSDDASGLEAVVCLAKSARVMLTNNLWIEVGLVNGAMGTIKAICYRSGGPPDLPLAVMVNFDHYTGPTLHDGTVPIAPFRRTWSNSGIQCSRLQLPLKLAWAVTIHKSQGLTLDKVVIDVGKKEFSCGLTYVACSRVQQLTDLLFSPPFPFLRLSSLANSQRLHDRQLEDQRLLTMQPSSQHTTPPTSWEPTSTPPSAHTSTPPPLSPTDSLPRTPTPPLLSPTDSLPCTPTPPSTGSSTPPPLSPMDSLPHTPTPPSSRSPTPHPHSSCI